MYLLFLRLHRSNFSIKYFKRNHYFFKRVNFQLIDFGFDFKKNTITIKYNIFNIQKKCLAFKNNINNSIDFLNFCVENKFTI